MIHFDISYIPGLIALGAIIVNLALGLGIWSRLRIPLPKWLPLLKAHKFTGYLAGFSIVLHILFIPLNLESGFRWIDLPFPLWTKHQPYIHSVGAVSFYFIAIVIISSYYKKKLKFKTWRKLHYLSYLAMPMLLAHALLTDPTLQDKSIDFLDGEKVYVEACILLFMLLGFYRFHAMTSGDGK